MPRPRRGSSVDRSRRRRGQKTWIVRDATTRIDRAQVYRSGWTGADRAPGGTKPHAYKGSPYASDPHRFLPKAAGAARPAKAPPAKQAYVRRADTSLMNRGDAVMRMCRGDGSRRRGRDGNSPRRRVAATPRVPRGQSAETSRGDAAGATWTVRDDVSRRRRSEPDRPQRSDARGGASLGLAPDSAAGAARIVRGDDERATCA